MTPEKSAIRTRKDDLDTGMNTPVVCRQCQEMECLDGERVTEVTAKKQFRWSEKRAGRSPFNNLSVLGQNAYHCDLCGGHPRCVRVCTSEAIGLKK